MTQTPTDALRLVPSREDGLRVGRAILEAHSQWEKEHGVTGAQNPWQEQHVILLGQAAILAAPASPLPEGGGQCSGISGGLKSGEDILWMMHVRGPDDIYPAPDYETAVAWCDYVNDVLAKAVPEVMTKAVPAIWTLSPQEHAAYLPEAIKGWALPAAPTGAK